MGIKIRKKDVLEYHSSGRKGKIEVNLSKPCLTQRDLSIAYTPGVAEVCRDIEKDKLLAYEYTTKSNLVGVVSNGTAVLGLGDIGPLAGKPVMEGKAVLFKRFADIDVFDIELDEKDPDKVIDIVRALAPTFGGINLEDIKAPDCFYIEEKLKKMLDIPVFHDDQHGTAIIATAGLMNAVEIQGKDITSLKVVVSGAGAAAIAIAKMFESVGVKRERIIMTDSKGVIYKGRIERMNPYKEQYASDTKARTLEDAIIEADVFVGVSMGGILSGDMVKSMAEKPIIFALANPDPEISYDDAKKAVPDAIVATGRSDYPNQINNVLGFPFIFRGALDVRAKEVSEEMKIAAAKALAQLAKEDVPESVLEVYGSIKLKFGADYIIPKPFDPRVLLWVAPAVAKGAMDSGVARIEIEDLNLYKEKLEKLLGPSKEIVRYTINKAKNLQSKKIVFPEGEEEKILKAVQIIVDEKIADPILLGNKNIITNKIINLGLEDLIEKIEIIDNTINDKKEQYITKLFTRRARKGMTIAEASRQMLNPDIFGAMMVREGDADGIVTGLSTFYPATAKKLFRIIEKDSDKSIVAGVYLMLLKDKLLFFADTTINVSPTIEELADIAILAADMAKWFDVEPSVAMLSFSNFGSNPHGNARNVSEAVSLIHKKRPDINVDGEMQVDAAVVEDLRKEIFPFSLLKNDANVLIFPNLEAANIAYKILWRLGKAEAIGPILTGMKKPANILQRGASVNEIVNLTSVTVLQVKEEREE